jgi:ABC-type transport system involved in multi-copper enzyme maturation permease subunit
MAAGHDQRVSARARARAEALIRASQRTTTTVVLACVLGLAVQLGFAVFWRVAHDFGWNGITGNVKKNSPFAVGVTLQTMAIFAVFIMAAFVSNVVIRDDETGYGQIVHSTRVSRFDYLFGRFTGAFAAGCAAFVSV